MNRKERRELIYGMAIEQGGTDRPLLFRKWDRRRKNRAARKARRNNRRGHR